MPGEALVRYALAANPVESPLPRADLYRKFTRQIQKDILEIAFPRTKKVLGDQAFTQLFENFLEQGGPSTLQYPSVPDDFANWASNLSHPYADLMDFERSSVRADRHPAQIDELTAPKNDQKMMLNPTLQVSSYNRPVHQITEDQAPPATDEKKQYIYLVWRRPLTDEISRQRLGGTLARSLGLLAAHSLNRSEWIQLVLDSNPDYDPHKLKAALLESSQDLIERAAILSAP